MEIFTLAPADARWRWYSVPDGDGAQVHLYMPDTSELNKILSRFARGTRVDLVGMQDYVARHWFDDFSNMTANGAAIENTLENRTAICRVPSVWKFVQETLLRAGELVTEGNDDGGSD